MAVPHGVMPPAQLASDPSVQAGTGAHTVGLPGSPTPAPVMRMRGLVAVILRA